MVKLMKDREEKSKDPNDYNGRRGPKSNDLNVASLHCRDSQDSVS
jgi:hypothetical protein